MILQTIEVEIDEAGHVRPLKPSETVPAGPALLTPLGLPRPVSSPVPEADDWHALVGTLRSSPNWRDEPQAVQQALRDEWR